MSQQIIQRTQLSLTSNFIWTFAGNAVYALCQWGVIVCLAKLGSAQMVGQFALALAVAFPITFLANLQLRVLFVTDQTARYPFGQILGLRLALAGASIGVLLATCALAGYTKQTVELMLIVAAAQLVDCLSENYYAVAQRYEHMDRIARSQILRSILSVSFLVLTVHYTGSLLGGAAGLVLGRMLVFFFYDANKATFATAAHDRDSSGIEAVQSGIPGFLDRIRPSWSLRNQLRMAWIASPLGAASMLISLNANMPRYFVQHFLGSRDLGIYSALSYIPAGCIMIATALGQAVFARLSKYYYFGQIRNFNSLLTKSAAFCGAVGLMVLLVSAVGGHEMLTILYRPEYAEHTHLLLWLMAGAAVGCVAACFGCAMTSTLHFKEQVPLLAIVLLSSAMACAILIPRWGLLGAALAALVSMSVQLIGSAAIVFYAVRNRTRGSYGSSPAPFQPALQPNREV